MLKLLIVLGLLLGFIRNLYINQFRNFPLVRLLAPYNCFAVAKSATDAFDQTPQGCFSRSNCCHCFRRHKIEALVGSKTNFDVGL